MNNLHRMARAMEEKSLTCNQRIVLLILINHTGVDSGECFPSLRRISEKSGLSRSTVMRAIDLMHTLGMIMVENRTRANGSSTSNLYKLNDQWWEEGCQIEPPPSVTTDTPPVSQLTPLEPTTKEPTNTKVFEIGAEKIWSVYPRKIGKKAGIKAIISASKRVMKHSGVSEADAFTMLYISVEKYPFGDEKKYIPHPSTFFNQERYLDEVEIEIKTTDTLVEMTKRIKAQEKNNELG